jgi:hypothetical protein
MEGKGPKKGTIKSEEGEEIIVEFSYNPKEYTISKAVTWEEVPGNTGSNSPPLQFKGGKPAEFSTLELLFDTYETGEDVRRKYTDKLFKLMMVNPKLPAGTTERTGQPPKCLFQWGTVLEFKCYVTKVSCTYTLFLADGTPVRATAKVDLKQAHDDTALPGTNPSSRGEGGERGYVVKPSDRLDLIAYEMFGDAGHWRAIARANKMTRPLQLRPGQTLVIPPRPEE